MTETRESCDSDHLSGFEIHFRPRVEVSESEFDDHAREVRRHFRNAAGAELLEAFRRELMDDIYATTITLTHQASFRG
jgi:hypothetical protein